MVERFEPTDPANRGSGIEIRIEEGEIKDPRILDDYFSAMITLERSNAAKKSGIYKEAYGERIVQYIKALNGSYQKEKASFCLAKANNLFLASNTMDSANPDRQEAIQLFRRHAANWLRMAAACLEMPEGKTNA